MLNIKSSNTISTINKQTINSKNNFTSSNNKEDNKENKNILNTYIINKNNEISTITPLKLNLKNERKNAQIGKISIIIGPMFSGKSTELIRNIKRYSIKKKSTIVVAYEFDNRYSNDKKVVTHDKYEYPAIKSSNLSDILNTLLSYEVIGIDEGQFYPDLVNVCEELANKGKIVIISALSGNFKREPFEVISKILPKCESILNISAICFNCNEDAHYTLRISEDKDEIVIGGEEKYKPSCRECYFQFNKTTSSNVCEEVAENKNEINKSSTSTLFDSNYSKIENIVASNINECESSKFEVLDN